MRGPRRRRFLVGEFLILFGKALELVFVGADRHGNALLDHFDDPFLRIITQDLLGIPLSGECFQGVGGKSSVADSLIAAVDQGVGFLDEPHPKFCFAVLVFARHRVTWAGVGGGIGVGASLPSTETGKAGVQLYVDGGPISFSRKGVAISCRYTV